MKFVKERVAAVLFLNEDFRKKLERYIYFSELI
jgi:hypothetical protein